MSGSQVSDCLGRIRLCDLSGGGVSLGTGFEVLKASIRPSLSRSLSQSPPLSVCSLQLQQCHACLSPAMLLTTMIIDLTLGN